MTDEKFLNYVPDWLRAKHPDIMQVLQALDEFDRGSVVSVRCPKCGTLLTVTDFPEIGSRWVVCGTPRCTRYHERYTPPHAATTKE